MVVDTRTPDLTDGEVDRLFQALADPTRRDILSRTITEVQSVSALARRYDMSLTAVQKHVAVLARASLVTKHRQGREQLVQANRDAVRRVSRLLDEFEQIWIGRVDRIADVLKDSTQ